jgi:hypothetical protein
MARSLLLEGMIRPSTARNARQKRTLCGSAMAWRAVPCLPACHVSYRYVCSDVTGHVVAL